VFKIQEGRPNPSDLIKNGEISLVMMTSTGDAADLRDGKELRRQALAASIPIVTTLAGAKATTAALRAMRAGPLMMIPLQDFFPDYYDDSLELMLL
jgi:carbamoyl-phosphate synthase large subunit